MPETRIWIVRHGNTFDPGDTVTRVGGRTDLALSQSGRIQADALAAHFAGLAFVTARTSPLSRTRETAETILAAQAHPPILSHDAFLREIDYGPDENRPEAEVVARIGEDALMRWDTEAIVPEGWQVDVGALIGGWRDLFAGLSGSPGDHLVVTSNGIARFALRAADAPDGTRLKLPTGGFGCIEISDGGPRISVWGERPAA